MKSKFAFVAAAIVAFCGPALGHCPDTVTVTITSIVTDCRGPRTPTTSPTSPSSTSSSSSTSISTSDSSSTVLFFTASTKATKSRRPHHHYSHQPDPATTSMHHPSPTLLDCQPDNCLRALQNTAHFPGASSFCATYTASVNTATTGFPEPIVNCKAKPSLISSACSCIDPNLVLSSTHAPSTRGTLIYSSNSTMTTSSINSTTAHTTSSATTNGTISSSSTTSGVSSTTVKNPQPPKATLPLDCQPDNCLRAFENKAFMDGPKFCATYTAGPSTPTEIPDYLRNCEANPTYLASACSCINTSLPGAIGYTSHSSSTTSTTSPGTSTKASTTTTTSPTSTSPNNTPALDPYVDCHQDNCFREAIQSTSQFSRFCSTYTTAVVTATSELPPFVAMCSQPAVISSVCSCIVAPTGTGTTVSSTSAGGNGGAAATSSASASSCAAVTVVYETRTQIATILTTVTAPSSSVLSAKVSATLRRRWGSQ